MHTAEAHLDTRTFASLYDEHRMPLYLFCLARTGDPSVAEDIVQDVFERAFRVRRRYDPRRPFWPWIASIAARECVDTHRRRAYARSRVGELATTLSQESGDNTSGTVLRRLDHSRLEQDIQLLPSRQRAALLLFAVDGWTYAEIAAQLGTSAEIVKSLIMRARTKLREGRKRALAAACGIGRHLRARLQQLATWSQSVGSAGSEVLTSWAQGLVPGGTAIGMALAVLLGGVVPSSSAAAAVATREPEVAAAPPLPAAGAVGAESRPAAPVPPPDPAPPPVLPDPPAAPYAGVVERTAHTVVASVLPPAHDTGPDTIQSSDVVVSPNYDEEPTVFVAGFDPSSYGTSSPLLVSRDGGASWHRPRATGLGRVSQLLLPPAYPQDPRLFAVTQYGLQVSRDGGESFETLVVLPTLSDASISPAFNRGDPTVLLVAGGQLFEHRLDSGISQLLALGAGYTGQVVTDAAFAADYPNDPSVLVASRRPGSQLRLRFSRCTRNARMIPAATTTAFDCADLDLPDPRTEVLRLVVPSGPTPGPVWLLNLGGVYVSHDHGATFSHTRPPQGVQNAERGHFDIYSAWDLAAVPSPTGASAILAQESSRVWYDNDNWSNFRIRPNPPLLRTDDAGRSWTPIHVDLPGFEAPRAVAVTPTGRIITGGVMGGLACSADGGRTWGHTCPTPDRAAA